jgi:polyphosphate kinase 2 (PPK2 family)
MRLTSALDPRGYRVVSTPAPTAVEKAHHYLWRFWNNIPQAGHIAIFDRSWYGRLMVEPIEGFCGQNEYERAFSEINEMEKHLTGSGIILIKFFIHISPEEQLARFNERKEDPNKNWKLTDEDYRNREKWPVYTAAIEKMFERTDTPYAPWNVISGNSKKHARIEILRIVTEKISKELEKRPAKQAFRKIK